MVQKLRKSCVRRGSRESWRGDTFRICGFDRELMLCHIEMVGGALLFGEMEGLEGELIADVELYSIVKLG